MKNQRPVAWLFPHPLAWMGLVIISILTAAWTYASGFQFYARGMGIGFLGMASLLLIAIWCSYRRILMAVPYLAFSLLFFALMSIVVLMISYLGIAAEFDLVDKQLAGIDKALGFDWPAHVRWVNDHPAILASLIVTYNLINKFLGFTFLGLFALKRYDRLRELLVLFFMIASVTVILGILFPALGGYSYYNMPADQIANIPSQAGRYYLEHFNALRDGSMTSLDLSEQTGLIQFPSFHTALALLVPWALRRTVVFWPMVVVSVVMLVSTISQGGHHFTDMVAGAGLTLIAIWIYQKSIEPVLARKDSLAYQSGLTGLMKTTGIPKWLHNMIATLTKTQPTTNP